MNFASSTVHLDSYGLGILFVELHLKIIVGLKADIKKEKEKLAEAQKELQRSKAASELQEVKISCLSKSEIDLQHKVSALELEVESHRKKISVSFHDFIE